MKMVAYEAAEAKVVLNTAIYKYKLKMCFIIIFWQSNVGINAPPGRKRVVKYCHVWEPRQRYPTEIRELHEEVHSVHNVLQRSAAMEVSELRHNTS